MIRPFPGFDDAGVGLVSFISGLSAGEFSPASLALNIGSIFLH
jgi:hypothetical protein